MIICSILYFLLADIDIIILDNLKKLDNMKRRLALSLSALFFLQAVFCQSAYHDADFNYRNSETCANRNAFLQGGTNADIQRYTSFVHASGMMKLDYRESWHLETASTFNQLCQLNSLNTFRKTHTYKSRLSRDRYFVRHQQYYQDVRVEGGGYTATYIIPNDPDDCEYLYMISPYLISNLNLSVSLSISEQQLPSLIANYHNTNANQILDTAAELVISSVAETACDYVLTWKDRLCL